MSLVAGQGTGGFWISDGMGSSRKCERSLGMRSAEAVMIVFDLETKYECMSRLIQPFCEA